MDDFGSHIRRLRRAGGLTLDELARHTSISIAYLSDIERGRRSPLTGPRLAALTKALGADADTLAKLSTEGRWPQAARDRIERLQLELACERGLTHREDGTPYPWTERGWAWSRGTWTRVVPGRRMRVVFGTWQVTQMLAGLDIDTEFTDAAAGALPAIEAAEAWLAERAVVAESESTGGEG